jgi:hypothetical protein
MFKSCCGTASSFKNCSKSVCTTKHVCGKVRMSKNVCGTVRKCMFKSCCGTARIFKNCSRSVQMSTNRCGTVRMFKRRRRLVLCPKIAAERQVRSEIDSDCYMYLLMKLRFISSQTYRSQKGSNVQKQKCFKLTVRFYYSRFKCEFNFIRASKMHLFA